MGFNISGLIINKNFENDFENLQKELGWKLEKKSEISFETASSNWKDEGICDVYFTDKGTLMFISMDMCTESFAVKDANTLTFALSETSMAFNISYCENGIEKRSIMEVEGERIQDEGEKLIVENSSQDTSEIIWNQIEVMLGKSFWKIESDEKAVRFIFTKNISEAENEKKLLNIDEPIPKDEITTFSDNDLFKYFDEIINFAQENKLNVFLHPWAHKNNSRKFMNLFSIISEISNRQNLSNEISKRMPIERFKLLCRFDPEKVDSKINSQMLQEMNMINKNNRSRLNKKKINKENKKWWEFWK